MRPQLQHEPGGRLDGVRCTFAVLAFISRAFAVVCEILMHRNFGSRYLGLHALAAAAMIPLWSMFWPGRSVVLLMAFWLLFLVALVSARISIFRSVARGTAMHSRYNGVPAICRKHPAWDQLTVKRLVEPAMVLGCGIALYSTVDPVLGSFLVAAAIGLFANVSFSEAIERARARDALDAMLEQQRVAKLVQEIRRGRF